MKEIKRYNQIDDGEQLIETIVGGVWCKWADVEELQRELQEARALALAAIYLIPEDENIGNLRHLAREANDLFMGKDKQIIAKLQDELQNAREYAQSIQRPTTPGVNAVYGTKPGDKAKFRYPLMITSIQQGLNGGLHIEVQLP